MFNSTFPHVRSSGLESIPALNADMADLHEPRTLPLQIESESAELSSALQYLDQRISNLTFFERAVLGRAANLAASTEVFQSDENLHKKIDLFTHFTSCSPRRRMGKFDRSLRATQQCKVCHDSSTTMDFESWQPNNHHITIQRFPAIAKKEARAWHLIQMGPAGADGTRGRLMKISRSRERVYMSEGAKTEKEKLSRHVSRSKVMRGRGSRQRVLVRDTLSDADVTADEEEYKIHGIAQDKDDRSGEGNNDETKWNEDDYCGMDILSADMAYGAESSDHDESYKESSSPVTAWYKRPERMGSTP